MRLLRSHASSPLTALRVAPPPSWWVVASAKMILATTSPSCRSRSTCALRSKTNRFRASSTSGRCVRMAPSRHCRLTMESPSRGLSPGGNGVGLEYCVPRSGGMPPSWGSCSHGVVSYPQPPAPRGRGSAPIARDQWSITVRENCARVQCTGSGYPAGAGMVPWRRFAGYELGSRGTQRRESPSSSATTCTLGS